MKLALLKTILTKPAFLFRSFFDGPQSSENGEELDEDQFSKVVDGARRVMTLAETAEPVLYWTSKILTGPALTGLVAGPLVAPIGAVCSLVSKVPLLALPALIKLAPVVVGPAIAALLAGPAAVPLFALLHALHLGTSLAGPILAGVAVTVLLVGPAIKSIMASLTTKHIEAMNSLLRSFMDLLLSSPRTVALLSQIKPLLTPLASLVPAVRPLQSLLHALLSNQTLRPLQNSIQALPKILANEVAETSPYPLSSAYNLLK